MNHEWQWKWYSRFLLPSLLSLRNPLVLPAISAPTNTFRNPNYSIKFIHTYEWEREVREVPDSHGCGLEREREARREWGSWNENPRPQNSNPSVNEDGLCIYMCVRCGASRVCNCATDLWVYFPKCRGFWTRCAYMGCFELGISKPNLAHTKLVKEKIFIYLFTKYWTFLSAITLFFLINMIVFQPVESVP